MAPPTFASEPRLVEHPPQHISAVQQLPHFLLGQGHLHQGGGAAVAAAVFPHLGAHGDDVRQVGNVIAVTSLSAMQICCPLQGLAIG
jgi:hypothetical protein